MNTRKLHVKPLAAAIAATLFLGLSSGVIAQDATGPATASTAATAPSAAQQTPPTDASQTTPGQKKNTPQSNAEIKAIKLKAIEVIGGIAGSQAQDLILKRYAPQITDSITAVNIGQLPDVTISDALSRIPGVQIGRSGGEGSTVSVRGLPEVQTTLNGEVFLSPGGGAGLNGGGFPDQASNIPDFIDIPPTLFSGADVVKSIMASDVAGGVSGIVNLRTHRPFDFKPGWTFSGSATGNWGERTQKFNKGASLLGSWRDDRWGGLFTVSYAKEDITNDDPQMSLFGNGAKMTEQDVGFDFNGDGAIGSSTDQTKKPLDYYYAWDPMSFGTINSQRKRLGVNGSLQFKFSDALELVADGMFTQMKETDSQYAMLLQQPLGLQPGPVAPVIQDGHVISGIGTFAQVTGQQELSHGPTNSLNTNLQLNYDAGGFFSGSLRWVHARAHRSWTFAGADLNPNQGNEITRIDGVTSFDNPNGIPNGVPVMMDFSGAYPKINILADVANPATWTLTSAYAAANKIRSTMNVFRGDGTLHFDNTGPLDSFNFGARYEKQHYVFNYDYYLTPLDPTGACADPLGPGPLDALNRYIDPRTGLVCADYLSPAVIHQMDNLPSGWLSFYNHFAPLDISATGKNAKGFPALNTDVMRDPVKYLKTVASTSLSGEPKAYQDPTQSWIVTEKIKSAYGQFNFNGNLGPVPWRGNIGVRWVKTDIDIGNFITNQNDFLGNSGSWNGVLINQGTKTHVNSYTSWLPALNVAFNITDDQIVRVAATKTQARQALSDLGRGLSLFTIVNGNPPRDPTLPQNAQIFVNGVSGNPDLQPYKSTNYDLSYGWYFAPRSLAYVGAFYMDVSHFPEAQTLSVREPDADGVVRRSGPLSTIVNGGGSIVRGLEGEFRTQFTKLPGWWSGFGVNFNYTYLHSSKGGAAGSSHSYNAVGFYQKYGVQVRLAYNWQSSAFQLSNSVTGDVMNVYSRPAGYLDASVQYDINQHFAVVVQATNLTNTQDRDYLQNPSAWWSANISERRYYAGVRVKF